jgi:hypothetical protein
MEDLILKWQKRQQEYEELAEKYKDNVHNNRKFTYKAMATRDCWKELYLQLLQPDVSGRSEQFVCLCPRTKEDNCDRKEPCKECETCPHFRQTNCH